MRFYPSDWRSEPTLKMVSRAARSFWIDCLCLIHEAGTGRLEVGGRPASDRDLAAIFGDNPRTVRKLLSEIEEAGVCSRDEDGFVISRRVIRDLLKAEKDANNGRMGGNPALKQPTSEESGLSPRGQRPEAISKDNTPLPPKGGRESKRRVKAKKSIDLTYSERFNRFWENYPRRVAKGDAYKAFSEYTDESQEVLIAAAAAFAVDEAGKDVQYIPYPATWIRGTRFTDNLEAKQDGIHREEREGRSQADRPAPRHDASHQAELRHEDRAVDEDQGWSVSSAGLDGGRGPQSLGSVVSFFSALRPEVAVEAGEGGHERNGHVRNALDRPDLFPQPAYRQYER